MPGDLGHDMGSGTETVDTETLRLAGHAQRAVADKAGAQQRGRLDVGIALRQGKAVCGLCRRVFGVAAVDLVAGEARGVAEVLVLRDAVGAGAAGVAEPGNSDAVAGPE